MLEFEEFDDRSIFFSSLIIDFVEHIQDPDPLFIYGFISFHTSFWLLFLEKKIRK